MTDANAHVHVEEPRNFPVWREVREVGTVLIDRRYAYRVAVNALGRQRRVAVRKIVRGDAPEGTTPATVTLSFPMDALPSLVAVLSAAMVGGKVVAADAE